MAVILVFLSLPAHIVLAIATTVEVNSGNTITLGVDQSQSNIPIDIKSFPKPADNTSNGLGAFGFILTWNNAVINVTSVTTASAPPGYTFLTGAIGPGTATIGGYASSPPYVSGNLTVAYLTITAVGSAGQSTSINVTIDELTDAVGNPIPATPVNVPLSIPMGELVLIAVTPAAPSIAVGQTQQFIATGTYTDASTVDITGVVTWARHNPSVATIDAAGLATSLAAGITTITATLYAIDGTATLTVSEAKTKEVVALSTEPGATDVSGSAGENGVFTEEATAESEDSRVGVASDEGSTTVKAPPPKPINWGLTGGIIAGVVVIGLVIWLALRRRTA